MQLTPDVYVPVLKFRTGEYQAIFRLNEVAKNRVSPLFVIPQIEFDFETWLPKHTVQEHVAPFAKRFHAKWKGRRAWVDIDPSLYDQSMDSGLEVITHVFDELRELNTNAVPVAGLNQPPIMVTALAKIISTDSRGVGVRVRLEDIMRPDFSTLMTALLMQLGVAVAQADLIVDLGTPAYQPYAAFATALTAALKKITALNAYRNFVVTGTAYPDSLKDINPPGGSLDRHDWNFYRALLSVLPFGMRRPNFGDYTIVNPAFVAIDMRMIKPAGKLVYTNKNQWWVKKGGAFRDDPAQMHDHCQNLVRSGNFRGSGFSDGDKYIEGCAAKASGYGPSSQTRWKEVAISHHTMHVLEDLATLIGTP
jgi:hypothetical protein